MLATEELSRSVIETAGQLSAPLKDIRTQELAIDMQTRLLELSKFQPIGSVQKGIARKYCRFQIREEDTKMNSATQNAIRYALARLLDTTPGDNDDAPKITVTIKQVFAICHENFRSINGTPICHLINEGMRKERAVLAQAEAKGKVPFANRNGKPYIYDGSDTKAAKIKKELTLAQREIANLKNQLHQAKENIARNVQ